VQGYKIYRAMVEDDDYQKIGETAELTFIDTPPNRGRRSPTIVG